MTTQSVNLFSVDVIPPRAGVEAEVGFADDGRLFARFQAWTFRRSWLTGRERDTRRSEWSGWFEYEGEPIRLTWSAFWPE